MKTLTLLLILLCLCSCWKSAPKNETKKTPHIKKNAVKKKPKKQNKSPLIALDKKEFAESYKKVFEAYPDFNRKALKKAFSFLDENHDSLKSENLCLKPNNVRNRKKIRNLQCLVIADYSKEKNKKRLLIINPLNGESEYFYTAHGKGSNPPDKKETALKAVRFSNTPASLMTSLGFYLTDRVYNSSKSTFGPAPSNGLRLDGLNCSNNNAKSRYIVMHTADYVPTKSTKTPHVGNSEGCVTVPEKRSDLIEKCKDGALVYTYFEGEKQKTKPAKL